MFAFMCINGIKNAVTQNATQSDKNGEKVPKYWNLCRDKYVQKYALECS